MQGLFYLFRVPMLGHFTEPSSCEIPSQHSAPSWVSYSELLLLRRLCCRSDVRPSIVRYSRTGSSTYAARALFVILPPGFFFWSDGFYCGLKKIVKFFNKKKMKKINFWLRHIIGMRGSKQRFQFFTARQKLVLDCETSHGTFS